VITGFHPDEEGAWVAELSCLHAQHVHHEPPFWDAPWVHDAKGREQRLGQPIDCPLCDRAELPEGLSPVRTTTTWTEATLPGALRRRHRLAAGVWGLLHVERGEVRFVARTDPRLDRVLTAGTEQPIPPDVEHHIEPLGPVGVHLEFLRRPDPDGPPAEDR
jgi:tellurite resistance-related uncharacterized protein